MRIGLFITLGIVLSPLSMARILPTPYQVDSYKSGILLIDFGSTNPFSAIKNSRSRRARTFTVIGSGGTATIELKRATRKCEKLCEESAEAVKGSAEAKDSKAVVKSERVCHYQGTYPLNNFSIGYPLLVIEGAFPIKVQKKFSTQKRQISLGGEKSWINRRFSYVSGPVEIGAKKNEQFRWYRDKKSKAVFLEKKGQGKDFYTPPIELNGCSRSALRNFDVLKCGELAELLYADKKLIFASFKDQGEAKAIPLAAFDVGKQSYFVVDLGLKGYRVRALLIKDRGKWKLLFHRRVRPSTC